MSAQATDSSMLSALGNRKTRALVLQGAFIACVVSVVAIAIVTARQNMAIQGVTVGWGFLDHAAGWAISFSLIPYDISDSYGRALVIGFLNTLLLGAISISLAVVIGTTVGTARLAGNRLLNLIATTFVQIFRNIPLILQAFFWYALLTHLPTPRAAIALPGNIYLSNRGIFLPALNVSATYALAAVAVVVITFATVAVLSKRLDGITRALMCLAAVGIAAIILIAGRIPDVPLFDIPAPAGLRFKGGVAIVPEFGAAIVAIALFGAAYVAEVVRAGFQAIPRGLTEAGHALGLKPSHIFWRVRLPLMIRFVMPTMTNQVVWLMKATTVGIAIGFSDFFAIIAQSINNSGQTITLVFILIMGFWTINMTIALVMNSINRAIAIPGYKK